MGVAELYQRDPRVMTRDLLASEQDKARRAEASLRAKLLRDDGADLVRASLRTLFRDAEARRRMEAFADLTDSQGLTRRIVGEMARPVYCQAPTRKITPDSAQDSFSALVKETRLNARMALALEAMLNAADAAIMDRYVPRLGRIVTSVLEAHEFTVIPHPDDPTIAVAYIYDKIGPNGKTWHVFVDDSLRFQIDDEGRVVPFEVGGESLIKSPAPFLPFTPLHFGERSSSFFEPMKCKAISRGDLQCRFLNLLALRKLKAQGFSQRWLRGDVTKLAKEQVLDPETAVYLGDDGEAGTFGDVGDARNYLDLLSAVKADVAANCGISRARLNQDAAQASSDVGLLEVRAELVRIMTEVEDAHFEVLKAVSAEHPQYALPADATMSIDFGEWELRTDRKAELEVFATEEKLGATSVVDLIMAKNPECDTPEKAWAKYEQNIKDYARRMASVRALNQPKDGDISEPGQDAADNGALGPMVRDGRMTLDAARRMSTGRMDDGAENDDEADQ